METKNGTEVMASQSEETTVLKRVRKRKRLCNEDNHTPKTTGSSSLSMFVQSALKQTPNENLQREGGHESSLRGSTSGRKTQKLVSCELQRRLEAVRFPGYGEEDEEEESEAAIDVFSESGSAESLDGIEEEEEVQEGVTQSKSSSFNDRNGRRKRQNRKTIMRSTAICASAGVANIQEFDSCSSESSDHFDMHTYHASSPLPQLHTSTPTHPHQEHSMTVRDFCNLACTEPLTTPTPEYKSIATPPSSPELATTLKLSPSRTSASVWMRHIALESAEISTVGGTIDDTMLCLNNTTLRGLGDSVESERRRRIGSRRRRGKVVPGGLAEAAERVAKHKSSEVTFWEHRARKIDDSEIDLSSCLTVEVCVVSSSHSLKVARCKILIQQWQQQIISNHSGSLDVEGSALGRHDLVECDNSGGERAGAMRCSDGKEEVKGKEGGEVTVLFSTRCAKFLDLQSGQCVRIHPPWQCLTTPPFQHKVVLCTHFCQLLPLHTSHHSTSHHLSTSPSTAHHLTSPSTTHPLSTSLSTISHRHRGVEGRRELSPSRKSPSPHTSTLLTKSQAQPGIAPTRLFPAVDVATVPQVSRDHTANIPYINLHTAASVRARQHIKEQRASDPLPPQQCHECSECILPASTTPPPTSSDGGTTADVCSSLLSAMEGSCQGELSLKCRVLRVYRRTVFNATCVNRNVPCVWTKRTSESSQKSRWCLLVCDVSGMLCELQVSDFTCQTWSDIVRSGEGGVYVFRSIRVLRRTNAARNPELFSLIRYLSVQLSLPTTHSCQSSNSGEIPGTVSVPVPSYCYVLVPCLGSVPIPSLEEDSLFPTLTLSPNSQASDHDWAVTRCNLYARVIHYQPEVPLTVQGLCDPSTHRWPTHSNPLTLHHGHYLFIITPSPPTSSLASPHHHPHLPNAPQLLRVYVKAQFPREHIEHILSTPGERVMIRDVEIKRENGFTWFTVDSCSMVHPLATDGDTSQVIYPQYKFSSDEESVLRNIPPPTLPPLTSVSDVGTIATITGTIIGIDEESAFSWPECSTCGNGKLSAVPSTTDKEEVFYCDDCQTRVDSSSTHLQLAVYIQPSQPSTHNVCAQLLQSTIRRILPVTQTSLDEGFEVGHVLKQSVCLDACYVQSIRDTKCGGSILYIQEICIRQDSSSDNSR